MLMKLTQGQNLQNILRQTYKIFVTWICFYDAIIHGKRLFMKFIVVNMNF